MDDFDEISKQILEEKKAKGIPEILVKNVNILFLDVSSTCTGYTIANLDISDKKAPVIIKNAGVLWFDAEWDHPTKYSYIFNAILTYFELVENIDLIIHEQYSINKDRMSGVMVVPEMIGAIKVAAKENGVKIDSFAAQSWRSELKIKPVVVNKKRDYKTPCKDLIKTLFTNIPDSLLSNITGKNRAVPSDLYDSMGLCLGWLYRNNYKKIIFNKCLYNTHIGFEQLSTK